ncbi:MAG TPA: RNA polymerase subunit sigma, partial [Solibacterales bacterium]|nr:RNA polymerase subunit sigma [Bryobacterales bacterium]
MKETASTLKKPNTITRLLHAWKAGDADALERLVPMVYQELRRIARNQYRREPQERTLAPTALVHEAFLRLTGGTPVDWQDRHHFLAVSSRVIRRLLLDQARRRKAEKRGSGQIQENIDELEAAVAEVDVDLVLLDTALRQLPLELRTVLVLFELE